MKIQSNKHVLTTREQLIFFLPLAFTSLLITVTHSLFNAGLARLPNPEVMIAAFAVSKSLMHVFQSPVMMIRQTVTALIDSRKNVRRTTIFLGMIVASVVFVLGMIAFSGASRWLFREVMGISGQTLEEAILMLQILFLFPAIVALRDYFTGFAIKFRVAPMLTIASIMRIIYVFIFVSLIDQMTSVPAAYLASLMFIGALAVEAIVAMIGTKLVVKDFSAALIELEPAKNEPPTRLLTYMNLASFYSPLIITTLIHTSIMPIVNSALARTHAPDMAISVFAVAWGLGMIVLSPFIMFHQIPLNFADDTDNGITKAIQKFAIIIALFCAAAMALMGFTDIGYFILTRWIGATSEISRQAQPVIQLMSVLPFLMVAREYYWGVLMRRRLTKHIWKGKAINLVSLVIAVTLATLVNLPNPAIVGVIGYIVCETAEFLFLYFVSKYENDKTVKRQKKQGLTN